MAKGSAVGGETAAAERLRPVGRPPIPSLAACQAPVAVIPSPEDGPVGGQGDHLAARAEVGDLSKRYVEPGHSACDRSKTSVGAPGCGPQPDTYVLPAASTVASHA